MQASDVVQIRQMLAAGRLTIPDPVTGYHRALYANCPKDRNESSVYRIERSREAITRVVFRCPICSEQFDVLLEKMSLR